MAREEIRHLSEEFLYILYKAALKHGNLCGVVVDNMRSEYLPDKQFQTINRLIGVYFKAHKCPPSIGVLTEKVADDLDCVELLETINEADCNETDDVLLDTLEEYIKDVKLKQVYQKIPLYYNKGQADKAQDAIREYAEWLNSFSLKASSFVDVLGTFSERHHDNKEKAKGESEAGKRVVSRFYVDDLDILNNGRNLRTQLTCFLASTGVGKSHIARHIGLHAATDDGLDVLHFQLEGSESEVINAYSGALIEKNAYLYEKGRLSDNEIERYVAQINEYAGNIDVRSFPRFNNKVSTIDIKNGIDEYKKKYGNAPDIVIIDSMDLLTDSSGKQWNSDHERHKRIAVANDLKDIAGDEDIWIVTTYQANIENRDWLNDEKNVLTEYNCSEAKGLARPLTHLISLNQSDNERRENIMRLHIAKSRFFKKGNTFKIATRYEDEVFYDKQRTMNLNKVL